MKLTVVAQSMKAGVSSSGQPSKLGPRAAFCKSMQHPNSVFSHESHIQIWKKCYIFVKYFPFIFGTSSGHSKQPCFEGPWACVFPSGQQPKGPFSHSLFSSQPKPSGPDAGVSPSLQQPNLFNETHSLNPIKNIMLINYSVLSHWESGQPSNLRPLATVAPSMQQPNLVSPQVR